MSTLAVHHVSVSVARDGQAPIHLEVSRLTLQMDEEWIPYVQADLVCPLGDGSIEHINPQAGDHWVTVKATVDGGRVDRLGDLTRRYRRKALASISTQFDGEPLAAVTRSTYHDFANPEGARRSTVRTWRLMLRSVDVDRRAGTVSMSLASGEARLSDWMHMSPTADRVPGQDMVQKLEFILHFAGFPAGITYRPATVPTDAEIGDEAVRAPGSSALEFVSGLTRHHGLMLWCDEFGLWHLATDRSVSATRVLRSAGADRSVSNELSRRSRDDGWVTAVMAIYTWEGVDHYDIYSLYVPNPESALILRFNRPFPGPGLAENTYRHLASRGRLIELQAVADYVINPGQTVRYESPRETVTGRLASIRWQYPDDQMSIRLREVGAA